MPGCVVRAVRDDARREAASCRSPWPIRSRSSMPSPRDGIIVDYRPGVVRCSPAFYNTEDEVRLLVDRLAAHVPAEDRRVS